MRISFLQAVCAASALTLLAGCSGGGSSSVAQGPGAIGQSGVRHQMTGRSTSVLPGQIQLKINQNHAKPTVSYDSCSATGMLVYMSDALLGVVNIYDNGTTLCGQITGFSEPQGVTVHDHVLYVANTTGFNVLAFKRGATTPFRTFTDPSGQYPADVAVAPDGTVIASNIFSPNTFVGSLSTWNHAGTFVGNFPRPDLAESFFITVFHNGTVYEDGFDSNFNVALWSLSCPAGNCGSDTELGTPFLFPGGLTQSKSCDLVATDQGGNAVDTFELPSMSPVQFAENGGDNVTIDTTKTRPYQAFTGDAVNNELVCYKYNQNGSSAGSCGTAAGSTGGQALGVAIDPGF